MADDVQEFFKIIKHIDPGGTLMLAIGWIIRLAYTKTVEAVGKIDHKLNLLLKYFNIKDDS